MKHIKKFNENVDMSFMDDFEVSAGSSTITEEGWISFEKGDKTIQFETIQITSGVRGDNLNKLICHDLETKNFLDGIGVEVDHEYEVIDNEVNRDFLFEVWKLYDSNSKIG